jgi:hypothetical protein
MKAPSISKVSALLVGACALVGVWVATTGASPAPDVTRVDGFGCIIIPPDWGGPIVLVTTDSRAQLTPDGAVNFTCSFDIPPGMEPASAFVAEGFLCAAYFAITTDTHAVARPSGTVRLNCHVEGA